jgi:hypothetical protein
MWFRAARRRLLSRGLAALLTLIVCGGTLDWGHAGGDDPDCNPVLVHHDHSAHHFSAQPPYSSPAPEHCYICHSLRLLHSTLIPTGARVADTVQATFFIRPDGPSALETVGTARSSRAPPALSL